MAMHDKFDAEAWPKPWTVDQNGFIVDAMGKTVRVKGDPAFGIVRAVNSHEALLAVCRYAVEYAERSVNPGARLINYEEMKAAIQKAEEQP